MKGTTIRTLIIIISLGLCLSAGKTIIGLWQRKDIVKVRESELSQVKEKNKELERELTDIQSDDYVERIARDKLGMLREGEAIVILPDRASGGGSTETNDNVPNWKKWWRLFF